MDPSMTLIALRQLGNEATRKLEYSTRADELSLVLHCCTWVWHCIPDFHLSSQRLNETLKNAYVIFGKRRKTALENVALPKIL